MRPNRNYQQRGLLCFLLLSLTTLPTFAAEFFVGGATVSITPDKTVALMGQRHTRIAQKIESPCLALGLAWESKAEGKSTDQAVFVACDLSFIPYVLRDRVLARIKERAADFPIEKLVISATHTHTAPVLIEGVYDIPKEVMQPKEYLDFATERIADVAIQAWQRRSKSLAGWGLSHAVVARNRLTVYADGKAKMYGPTNKPDFARMEGYEDHGVEILYFWNEAGKLTATVINVACPAQDVADNFTVNADFWHPIRELLKSKYGEGLIVMGWIGAGGDQSPWPLIRKPAEERMLKLRKTNSLDAIAKRVVAAWEEAYEGAQHDKQAEPVLAHRVETIALPMRQVTQEDYLEAKRQAAINTGKATDKWNQLWHQKVIDRFESQKPDDVQKMELHVVRLGDVVVATNEFELYTDYGMQMKARSPALQTFVIQLAGPGPYLPADRSLAGGAYGSVIQSGLVGPEGGKILVEKTLDLAKELWPTKKP